MIFNKLYKFLLLIGFYFIPINYALAFGIVVLETDFGPKNTSSNLMKGAMYSIDNQLLITDLTNNVQPYNIWEGAYRLFEASNYWPKNTVFVFALESSPRKDISIVAKTKNGQYFIGPDNGFLTLISQNPGIAEVRKINNPLQDWKLAYSELAAKLASGELTFEALGPVLTRDLVQLPYQAPALIDNTLLGEIVMIHDPFGNAWTNIPKKMADTLKLNYGECFQVTIYNNGVQYYSSDMPFLGSFDQGLPGQDILYLNSMLNLSVAINKGSFAEQHKVSFGPTWTIKIKKGEPKKCLKNLPT